MDPECEPLDVADEAALAAFVAIHEEAAAWLWERGIEQWRPGEFTVDALRTLMTSGGEVYLARREGVPVGGFTLQWEDALTWGELPPDAGYLHALCVRRDLAGQGLGAVLLEYASRRVAQAGRAWLRLDCWNGNAVLRAFYERQGFKLCALAAEDGYHVALYERAAGEGTAGEGGAGEGTAGEGTAGEGTAGEAKGRRAKGRRAKRRGGGRRGGGRSEGAAGE